MFKKVKKNANMLKRDREELSEGHCLNKWGKISHQLKTALAFSKNNTVSK